MAQGIWHGFPTEPSPGCVNAGLKLLMIRLPVMRCTCEKFGRRFIPCFVRRLGPEEWINLFLLVWKTLNQSLTCWRDANPQALSNRRSNKNLADQVIIFYYLFVLHPN